MLNNTLTLPRVYDKRTQNANTSTFAIETDVLSAPKTLTISHSKRKNSTYIDTVAYIDDEARPVSTGDALLSYSKIRVQIKLSYDPQGGRSDIASAIQAAKADLDTLITNELASLLNREV
jgi:hypothetical protein